MKQSFKSHARVAALLCGTVLFGASAAKADQVIPDDLIVQGSICAGFDCVNNESFGFDTIILKENNLRIFFNDTSVSAGFPANDWRLVANDSGSGGANFFAIEDATAGRNIFTVTAGAPVASLFVDSQGRVGLRNSAPLLDLHMTTNNTPALRLEQNNSGGFTAQTWDVGGNEANFFVRDLTGGSRLSFRIRPGAPTSSIDIAANGNVGFGTASPTLAGGTSNKIVALEGSSNPIVAIKNTTANRQWGWYVNSSGALTAFDANGVADRIVFSNTGGVRLAGITGCGGGIQSNGSGDLSCIVSSRQFKNVTGDLPHDVALANVMAMRPQTGSYKETPDVPEHWLIAEEVGAIDPALIGLADGKPYVVKTQNIVADLVAVVQQQQRRIDELEKRLAK